MRVRLKRAAPSWWCAHPISKTGPAPSWWPTALTIFPCRLIDGLIAPDAEELIVRAQIDAPAADGRGGEAAVAEVARRNHLEFRPGAQHVHFPGLVGNIDQSARQHRRRTEPAGDPFL